MTGTRVTQTWETANTGSLGSGACAGENAITPNLPALTTANRPTTTPDRQDLQSNVGRRSDGTPD